MKKSIHVFKKSHLGHFIQLVTCVFVVLNLDSCGMCKNHDTKPSSYPYPQPPNSPPATYDDPDPSLQLDLTSYQTLFEEGDKICCNIKNISSLHATRSNPKLRITRTKGAAASIQGATAKGSGQYEIDLNAIDANNNIVQDLIVLDGADTQATFEIQLMYKDKPTGSPITIEWSKKKVWIDIHNIHYDKNSQSITCSIVNNDTKPLTALKIPV